MTTPAPDLCTDAHAELLARSASLEARAAPGSCIDVVRPSRLPRSKPGVAPQDEEVGAAERAWAAAASVVDPEIPVLTIADLGVLRDVTVAEDGAIEVSITPTYSGCPAVTVIAIEIELALARAGFGAVRVRSVLAPAWTTDSISEDGRRKLREFGIAPPAATAGQRGLFGLDAVACPLCGAADTEKLAEFGSTACKALWRCRACREPFDAFKCL